MGVAWFWGYNVFGQLGDQTRTGRSSPVSVVGEHTFTHIAVGGYHSLGIDSAGKAWAWGYNLYGQLGDQTRTGRSGPVSVAGSF